MLTECLAIRRALGAPERHRRDAVDAVDAASAPGRRRAGPRVRGGSDRTVSRAGRPGRRSDTGCSIWAKSPCGSPTTRERPQALRAMPCDRPRHPPRGARRRVRTESGRARAGRGRPRRRAKAFHALARGMPRRRGQAQRGDRALVSGKDRRRGGDRSSARARFAEASARLRVVPDEFRGARLPRGFRRTDAGVGSVRRCSAAARGASDHPRPAYAFPACTAANRGGSRASSPRARRLGETGFDAAWAAGTTWALDDAIECALVFAAARTVT